MKLLPLLPTLLLIAGRSALQPVTDDPVRHLLEASIPVRKPNLESPAVAIARPSLPPYLERTEFVTRTGDGRVKLHDEHLWSEPLDAAICRVLAENLRRLTGSTNIQPSSGFISPDYTALVEVRIDQFDPLTAGTLLLECTWKGQPTRGGDALQNSPCVSSPAKALCPRRSPKDPTRSKSISPDSAPASSSQNTFNRSFFTNPATSSRSARFRASIPGVPPCSAQTPPAINNSAFKVRPIIIRP